MKTTVRAFSANATAFKVEALANGAKAIAFKVEAIANGAKAIAFKVEAIANGAKAIAFKVEAIANGAKAIAFKVEAIANGAKAIAFMVEAIANGAKAIAFMVEAIANGAKAIAFMVEAITDRPETRAGQTRRIDMSSDWMPGSRTEQLAMAKNWHDTLQTNSDAWEVSAGTIAEIAGAVKAADAALTAAKTETTRTPVATARCKQAFTVLTTLMRDVKKRHFYVPPLQDSDLIGLGLKPHDTIPTPSGVPTSQVTVETFLTGRHELGIKIIYVTGAPSDAANKGFRIWYSVLAPEETAPAAPDGLHTSFFTKRKKDVIEFDYNDSGKTAHFAVQIENNGKKGPWGPLVSALIP